MEQARLRGAVAAATLAVAILFFSMGPAAGLARAAVHCGDAGPPGPVLDCRVCDITNPSLCADACVGLLADASCSLVAVALLSDAAADCESEQALVDRIPACVAVALGGDASGCTAFSALGDASSPPEPGCFHLDDSDVERTVLPCRPGYVGALTICCPQPEKPTDLLDLSECYLI